MNRGESLDGRRRHFNHGRSPGLKRERGKERERQMAHGFAKLLALGAVPGVDGIKLTKRVERSAIDNADQVKRRVRDRARAVGKADQRENRALGPDFRKFGARRFKLGQGKDHVADGAGANQKTAIHYFKWYSLRALSRSTMRANSNARSRVISLSRNIPVNARPSASRPVALAKYAASSQPISGGANG